MLRRGFDVFNRAQHADGYDIVEVVARQSWVLNHVVGMAGLSYPGISQLWCFCSAPSLPPSFRCRPSRMWQMQWPGGIYNRGFTRQWVNARERESRQGGTSWVTRQIEAGDQTCEDIKSSALGLDFEPFLRALSTRPEAAEDRNLVHLITQTNSAVFGGAFQTNKPVPNSEIC